MSVADAFEQLIPSRRRMKSSGWIEFKCPACGDRRGRGSFLRSDTGGFRYFCFNGGCEYDTPTGYEPGGGLGGRPRKLFELLGGNPIDLPWDEILRSSNEGQKDKPKDTLEVVKSFPSVDLPQGSIILSEVSTPAGRRVRDYLRGRGAFFLDAHPFHWSPRYPDYLITPWLMGKDIIGWEGRHIDRKEGDSDRFIFPPEGKAPDYLFNQHLVREHAGRKLFVVEGSMDAIALNCLAARSSRLTQKQINLLTLSGKDIVLIPDRDSPEAFIETAKIQNWFISCPEWGAESKYKVIKDVGRSVQVSGCLKTIETIMAGVTNNHLMAEMFYNMNKSISKNVSRR